MTSANAHIQQDILLIADPKILAIPVHENHEELVDLRSQNIIAFGSSPEVPNNTDYTKMRKQVYDKLVEAQALLPNGLKFRIYEALRSLSLQERLFKDRFEIVKKSNPAWSHEDIFKETTRLVSPVVNIDGTRNVPPHSTGAAIDIYLIDGKGQVVDMGIRTEDWILDEDGSISVTDSTKISAEAQANRKIMGDALSKVGFVNYKTEYWHWSYGDRYWAYYKEQPFAFYGSV
ncbi:MAG TPA: M15 family metallopeptidase [Gammaproteobacteria bacterium]|nr:M15 family metallopeptidase [Gammaproteobacteria bacterium]